MTDSFVSTANVINFNKGDSAVRQVAVEDEGIAFFKEAVMVKDTLN
jgi:hypothetical protein